MSDSDASLDSSDLTDEEAIDLKNIFLKYISRNSDPEFGMTAPYINYGSETRGYMAEYCVEKVQCTFLQRGQRSDLPLRAVPVRSETGYPGSILPSRQLQSAPLLAGATCEEVSMETMMSLMRNGFNERFMKAFDKMVHEIAQGFADFHVFKHALFVFNKDRYTRTNGHWVPTHYAIALLGRHYQPYGGERSMSKNRSSGGKVYYIVPNIDIAHWVPLDAFVVSADVYLWYTRRAVAMPAAAVCVRPLQELVDMRSVYTSQANLNDLRPGFKYDIQAYERGTTGCENGGSEYNVNFM